MSTKNQRRHARKVKRARHEAKRATQQPAVDPAARAGDTSAGPVCVGNLLGHSDDKSNGPSPEVPADTVQMDNYPLNSGTNSTPGAAPAQEAQGVQEPSYDLTPREPKLPSLPEPHDQSPYDFEGRYQPLPDRVRAGILEAVISGLKPNDAAWLYGIGMLAMCEHMKEDTVLHRDVSRASVASKLYHVRVIHDAPSSERVRASKWFLKTQFPEEFDPVIVSRRARDQYQAQLEEEAARQKMERRQRKAAEEARLRAEYKARRAQMAREESAAPDATAYSKAVAAVDAAEAAAATVQSDENRSTKSAPPHSQSGTAA